MTPSSDLFDLSPGRERSREQAGPAEDSRAAEVIRAGGVVAFPTETVYGLGADAFDPVAVSQIYTLKGRPEYNPLIVHCANAEQARTLAREWGPDAERLAAAFWPGPLTLVVPKVDSVPSIVTAGLDTVALRVPSHPVAQALLREAGRPIAAPSANRSMALSPTRAEHVLKGFGGEIMVLDAGPAQYGIESTVVDLTSGGPRVLRPGSIGNESLENVLGRPLHRSEPVAEGDAHRSPGMMDRHYSPHARLILVPGGTPTEWADRIADAGIDAAKVGVVTLGEPCGVGVGRAIAMPTDPEGYARALYAELHRMDDSGCGIILVEQPPEGEDWRAIRDRLHRAAGGASLPGVSPAGE